MMYPGKASGNSSAHSITRLPGNSVMEINHPEVTPNKRVPMPTPSISQKVFSRYPGITVLNKCTHTFSSAEPAVTIKEITGKTNKTTSVSVHKFQLPDIFREKFIITMVICTPAWKRFCQTIPQIQKSLQLHGKESRWGLFQILKKCFA